MSRMIRGAVIGLAAALALTACGSSSGGSKGGSNPLAANSGAPAKKGTVVIGSANFYESTLVGEIYAQALESKGLKVTRHFSIGAREVYYPQVQSGAITIIPEYNGALLTTSVDKTSTAVSTADVDAALASKLPSSLEVLNPSPAQNKDSVTVTKATATKYHLTSISDLSPVASKLVIGGPPEFKTRDQGLVGLKSKYGLNFKKFQALDEAGPISIAALKSGRVQAADIFSTDPSIPKNGFVSLLDPKNIFTAQNIIPLVYKSAATPTITSTLNAISAKLTQADLVAMDAKIVNDKDDQATVAKAWLQQVGL
jgi:osmoprotectant transport system substrate-binding protein